MPAVLTLISIRISSIGEASVAVSYYTQLCSLSNFFVQCPRTMRPASSLLCLSMANTSTAYKILKEYSNMQIPVALRSGAAIGRTWVTHLGILFSFARHSTGFPAKHMRFCFILLSDKINTKILNMFHGGMQRTRSTWTRSKHSKGDKCRTRELFAEGKRTRGGACPVVPTRAITQMQSSIFAAAERK